MVEASCTFISSSNAAINSPITFWQNCYRSVKHLVVATAMVYSLNICTLDYSRTVRAASYQGPVDGAVGLEEPGSPDPNAGGWRRFFDSSFLTVVTCSSSSMHGLSKKMKKCPESFVLSSFPEGSVSTSQLTNVKAGRAPHSFIISDVKSP